MRIYLTRDYDSRALSKVLHEAGMDTIETTYSTDTGHHIEVPSGDWLYIVRRVDPGADISPRPF